MKIPIHTGIEVNVSKRGPPNDIIPALQSYLKNEVKAEMRQTLAVHIYVRDLCHP